MSFKATITDSFDDKTTKSLWSQGVNLDDWDYAIIFDNPDEVIESFTDVDSYDRTERTAWRAKDYTIDRLLTGCCDNKWYEAEIDGKKVAIGIAYHS